MITFLRFVGLMNAAVWLGGSVFHVVGVAPLFSSVAVRWLLGDVHAGGTGLLFWERFYLLQFCCIGVAFLHLLAEWIYLGRNISRWNGGLLATVLILALAANLELDRAVTPAHWNRGNLQIPADQRARAVRVYPLWTAVWHSTNAALGIGVLIFTWGILSATHGPRFVTQAKFRTPDSLDG